VKRSWSFADAIEREPMTQLCSVMVDGGPRRTELTASACAQGMEDDAEAVARVKGTSVNQLIVDSLSAEIERVRGFCAQVLGGRVAA